MSTLQKALDAFLLGLLITGLMWLIFQRPANGSRNYHSAGGGRK